MTPNGGLIELCSITGEKLDAKKEYANVTSPAVKEAVSKASIVHDASNFLIPAFLMSEDKKFNFVQHRISMDTWNIRTPKNVACISPTHRQHTIYNSFGYQPLPFPPYVSNMRGIHVKDARVVTPDIDLDLYKPSTQDKGGYWIWFSRCVPDKGLDTFIEIARRCPKEKFKMFGSHSHGDHYDYFYKSMESHPVPYAQMIKETPNIELLEEDYVKDMQRRVDLIAGAKAFIFPVGLLTNYAEAFGLVLLESLACYTPVLTTPFGSVPDIIDHGRTGFICSDVETFIERMGDVDKIKPYTCRQEAEKYRLGTQAESFVKLYREVLSGETW